MTNLLQETRQAIRDSGHEISDIVHIGNEDYKCSWEEFEQLADIEYHCGFGAQEVATDLLIVFSDGSNLWRSEYDGAESWDYSIPFKIEEKEYKKIKRVVNSGYSMWDSLDNLHEELE